MNTDLPQKPRLLLIDDEARLLGALRRVLPRMWDIVTESDPIAAVALLQSDKAFTVVMTDYKMPGLNGLQVLESAKRLVPHAIRLMLTGYADLETTLQAVNDGSVFRILTKPCDRDTVTKALQAAVTQYELIQSEKQLLEQTLQGTVELLVDLQALQNPEGCQLNHRLRTLASEIATELGREDNWAIEMSAILAHLGLFACPVELTRKYLQGQPLTEDERTAIDRVPSISSKMVAHIPRMEPVAEIIALHRKHFDGTGPPAVSLKGKAIPLGARILHLATGYLRMESMGQEPEVILHTLRHATGYYDPDLLRALAKIVQSRPSWTPKPSEKCFLDLGKLEPGMRLVENLCSREGMLLLPAGIVINHNHLARIRSFSETIGVKTPLVVVKEPDSSTA